MMKSRSILMLSALFGAMSPGLQNNFERSTVSLPPPMPKTKGTAIGRYDDLKPFQDSNGRWYQKDAKGTIKRVKNLK